jgi:hypothetical protein
MGAPGVGKEGGGISTYREARKSRINWKREPAIQQNNRRKQRKQSERDKHEGTKDTKGERMNWR